MTLARKNIQHYHNDGGNLWDHTADAAGFWFLDVPRRRGIITATSRGETRADDRGHVLRGTSSARGKVSL